MLYSLYSLILHSHDMYLCVYIQLYGIRYKMDDSDSKFDFIDYLKSYESIKKCHMYQCLSNNF